MGRRVRGRVVVAALAVGLLPTAALAAPAAFDAWDSYRENRQNEALLRRSRPALDTLRGIEVPGLAPCGPRPQDFYGACLGSDTVRPLDVAGPVRDRLRAAGATDVAIACRHTAKIDYCNLTGRLHGVHIAGHVGPRLAPGRLYGVEVMLHVDFAPGMISLPTGGTPVPVP